MARDRARRTIYDEISEVRRLQREFARQRAHRCASDREQLEGQVADARAEMDAAFAAWEHSVGHSTLDLALGAVWSVRLAQTLRHVEDLVEQRSHASKALEQSRGEWARAERLADAAETRASEHARLLLERLEERRLKDWNCATPQSGHSR